ncbi:MAG: ATP-binding cassette domain-containing protein [Candidatus Sabulitectum sp.]|nr:ATP-binding cassette domain-containing protein [Candidatus Sabulitectum sp.]
MRSTVIEFKNIHLNFNDRSIIQNLSLKINQGDKVVLSGKSGCGKSSLLSLLLGFITPREGKVFFDGAVVDEKTVWDVRKRIAYIDQDTSLGSGTVHDLLVFVSGLKINAHLNFAVNDLMKLFELNFEVIHKNIKELSGGERQRLAIVIAVLLNRDVFFLDEITASLDKHLKKKVADFFLNREDWTCVVVSHDPVWTENSAVRVFDFEEKKWKH